MKVACAVPTRYLNLLEDVLAGLDGTLDRRCGRQSAEQPFSLVLVLDGALAELKQGTFK